MKLECNFHRFQFGSTHFAYTNLFTTKILMESKEFTEIQIIFITPTI